MHQTGTKKSKPRAGVLLHFSIAVDCRMCLMIITSMTKEGDVNTDGAAFDDDFCY